MAQNSYQSKLILTLYSEDRSHCAVGSKLIETPFPPYAGLEITENWSKVYIIQSAIWDMHKQEFHCRIEDSEVRNEGGFFDIQYLATEAKNQGFSGFEKIIELGDD